MAIEDSPELRKEWNKVYSNVVINYNASLSDTCYNPGSFASSSKRSYPALSTSSPSSSFILGPLITLGRRAKDSVLNLLLDAIALKFEEMEIKIAEYSQRESALDIHRGSPTNEKRSSLQPTVDEEEEDETEDEDPFFNSPSLMNYNLKTLNHSRIKIPSPSKNKTTSNNLGPVQNPTVPTNLQEENPIKRQLKYEEPFPMTPELIEMNDNERGFLDDSTVVIDGTPPPVVKSKHQSVEEPKKNSNSILDDSMISMDATILPAPKHSFLVPKKKKEAWVDATISHHKSKTTKTSNPKKMRQVNLFTLARNFPQKKVDVTTLKEYNGGSLSLTDMTSDTIGNENLNKASGSKRKSDEVIEGTDKRDKLSTSSLSETMFEVSPIKVGAVKETVKPKSPPSSPKPSTSGVINKKNKPLSPVQVNSNQNHVPQKNGVRKEKLDFTLELIKDFDKIPKRGPPSPKFRYKEETVRKKNERALLIGHACHECEQYFEGLESQVDEKEKARIMNKCSRHRSRAPPANMNTPPDFWCTKVPPTQELYEKGYIKVSSVCFTPKPRPPRKSDDSDDSDYMF